MRTRTLVVLLLGAILLPAQVTDLNAKVARLTVGVSTFEEFLGVFGEPNSYLWGKQTFTRDNLPAVFIASYPGGFSAVVSGRKVVELRFSQPGFVHPEKLQAGSPLEDVLKVARLQEMQTCWKELQPELARIGRAEEAPYKIWQGLQELQELRGLRQTTGGRSVQQLLKDPRLHLMSLQG
jgi:hypothetical protein